MNYCKGLATVLLFITIWDQGLGLSSSELTSRLESSKLWLFKRSEIYKGRRYYLSQQDPVSRSEKSMATCVLYGGYLAEIDDKDEFNFIKNFVRQFNGYRLVLIGGTDEEKEEDWTYRHSRSKVPGFIVKSRNLGNSTNCLYLFNGEGWMAIDNVCYSAAYNYPTRYLCEIPEDKR